MRSRKSLNINLARNLDQEARDHNIRIVGIDSLMQG